MNRKELNDHLTKLAAIREQLAQAAALERPHDSAVAAVLNELLSEIEQAVDQPPTEAVPAGDNGLAHLIGLGPEAITTVDATPPDVFVQPYEDAVTSERLVAVANLYYQYQHEKAGIFVAILKLQELFKAGKVRLSSGPGALGLYQYDRKRVLRTSAKERLQAYRRVFGYTSAEPPAGSKPNAPFHGLFVGFNSHVARFFRDKRISDVVKGQGAADSFGSVATVRRAGLDLRSNLKAASYGYVNVLTIELSQLLQQSFDILRADDVRNLFGAETAWDVLEEVLRRYMGRDVQPSQRSRLARAGRDIIRWLARSYVLNPSRGAFENTLGEIAEDCEEWITTASSLGELAPGASRRPSNVVPLKRSAG